MSETQPSGGVLALRASASGWRQAAAQARLEAAKYSPRGARQAHLRGQADALERCAAELDEALNTIERCEP